MKKLSIIIPVYNVRKDRFKRTLESVLNQTYKNIEICISDASSIEKDIEKIVKSYQKTYKNIKYIKSEIPLKISDNTNNAMTLATGDYYSFLDHDDLLHKTAVEKVMNAFLKNQCDVVYTDEQIVDDSGKILNMFYKPDFSPDLLYAQNYICHFLVFSKEMKNKVGNLNYKYDGAQDYDYILRLYEETDKFYHVAEILYDWLSTEESTSTNPDAKSYAQDAGLEALNAHLKRKYGKTAYAEPTKNKFVYQARFDLLKNQKIGIIIPMKDNLSLTQQCIYSIIKYTKYKNYEILILDNNSVQNITKDWLKDIKKYDSRITVIDADFEFNWSKLQNLGIKKCNADVYVLLNNDTVVTDGEWLTILSENALRKEVGVVGPLLEYEDKTIQHGGVIIGLGGYADHLYKGMNQVHANINFVSPMVPRNVLAVTGACMAISKETLNKIGYFSEEFIICGSDVEICLRAYEQGFRNIYTPYTSLVHLESKSRDSYIPKIDFEMSKRAYGKYWENGDPFFNTNLSLESFIPISKKSDKKTVIRKISECKNLKTFIYRFIRKIIHTLRKIRWFDNKYMNLKSSLKKNKNVLKIYRKLRRIPTPNNETIVNGLITVDYRIPEINKEIVPRKDVVNDDIRINILIPSLNKDKVFGGIATAMKFFNSINGENIAKRIIITDTAINSDDLDNYKNYKVVECGDNSSYKFQVVDVHDAANCKLSVASNDIFIATAWWTAYNIKPVIDWQTKEYKQKPNKLLYFIQDYEPYFYPWSSRYCYAESTYKFNTPTIAIFNSIELRDFMINMGYNFEMNYHFDPILNDKLKEHLLNDAELKRKKRIIVYGRPGVARNAFEIICDSLIKAFKNRDDSSEWELVSMGEDHYDVVITEDNFLKSVGKLSIDEYAKMMEESYMGISLMISPHPSYPPLEMSTFGVRTITNCYSNKNMSEFNENIVSVDNCNSDYISKQIVKLLDNYNENGKKVINDSYINASNQFDLIIKDIMKKIVKNNK